MGTSTAKKPAGKSRTPKATRIEANKTAGNNSRFDLHKELNEYFGFTRFKGTQEKVIESLLAGRDTFVIMPTGGGKSLCYQLPAMVSEGVAIVVSPLIALMKNQVDLVRGYSSNDEVAHFLNSTLNKKEIKEVHM
jgi:ATP-dependent DNA helicase RecQ